MDQLLKAGDLDAALADSAIAFTLPKIDQQRLLELLSAGVPRLQMLHGKFPDAYQRFDDLQPYRRDGRFNFRESIGTEFDLVARWTFRLDPLGDSIEQVTASEFRLMKQHHDGEEHAVPIYDERPLTDKDLDLLAESDDLKSWAETIWNSSAE